MTAIQTATRPTTTSTVNQQFFIESQQGAQSPTSYLDIFPESIYTHSIDSILIKLLYVLMGPVGAGFVRQGYLEQRLQVESALLQSTDLDALYANPLGFARLAKETYEWDTSASLLSAQDRATILALDSDFRNRALHFLQAVRAGGTRLGIQLAAESGLDHPVDVIENYKALWDQYSDRPLNLEFKGRTTQTNEAVIVPLPSVPLSSTQSLQIVNNPASGWFTLSVPLGPDYQFVPVTIVSTNTVTVPDTTQTPVGTYLSVSTTPTSSSSSPAAPTYWAEVSQVLSPTLLQLIAAPGFGSLSFAGGMINNTYWAYSGYGQTVPLPYNATWDVIQNALMALPVIGPGNIQVSGGPLPNVPVEVLFTDDLANMDIPEILFNIDTNTITGVTDTVGQLSPLKDITGATLVNSDGVVTIDHAGSNGQKVGLSWANRHNMQSAIDQIRPMTSMITINSGNPKAHKYHVNRVHAPLRYTEVVHYARGNAKVRWHKKDKKHWVRGGHSSGGPRPPKHRAKNHSHFHNINKVTSYTEEALSASDYGDLTSTNTPIWARYWNTHAGDYNPNQVALYPMLSGVTQQLDPAYSVAAQPNPLIMSTLDDGTGIINDQYPVDYLGLPNVQQLPTDHQWYWSSRERLTGTDHLEIDLGQTRAVNFISFHATRKPYAVSVSYDVLDQPNRFKFIPVTIVPMHIYPSTTSLAYTATATNPWIFCHLAFTNNQNRVIHTRYLRLEFTKTPGQSPLATGATGIPYSIEIRHLRCGRLHLQIPPGTPTPDPPTDEGTLTVAPGIIA